MAHSGGYLCQLKIAGKFIRDPIEFTTKTGKRIIFFSIAYNSPRGGRSVFFNFVAFKELGEYIYSNYKKGDFIRITQASGLETNDYPDKNDPNKTIKSELWKCSKIDILGEELSMFTYKEDDGMPFEEDCE